MDSNIVEFIDKINSGEVFFFAGSGISYDSGMPSAYKILKKTAETFLPHDKSYEDKITQIINKIQPEVLYENLLYLVDSFECLRLWSILEPSLLIKYGQQAFPNINHLFIVEYSVKNKVPIITTNFDTLFEEAARILGYEPEVVLPYTSKEEDTIQNILNNIVDNKKAYIFKIHGTIELQKKETLELMFTTMSTISKANYKMLRFIKSLSLTKHIVFVGYSGKDVDYFPEMIGLMNKKPYWINKFNPHNDDGTYANAEAIGAIRIGDKYPAEFFNEFKCDKSYEGIYKIIPHINMIRDDDIFDDLQKIINKKVDWDHKKSFFFLILLCKEIGDYKFAYDKLKELKAVYKFPESYYQMGVLIYLSKLSHENSKYESCQLYAEQVLLFLKNTSKKNTLLIPYEVVARCLISESKRMLTAHDTSFSRNFNILPSISAFLSFISSSWKINKLLKKIDNKKVLGIWAKHESIENKIRFFALLQAISMYFGGIRKNLFVKKWGVIRRESFIEGYSHGIANSLKFQMRITGEVGNMNEAKRIFHMTTAATGMGLLLRNKAEICFEERKYDEAKGLFDEFFNTSLKCGNILNAIKGLLGMAKCNRALGIKPLLTTNEQKILHDLMIEVEGHYWQKYFRKVQKEIES